MNGDRWYAFECFNHHEESRSGLVFDVRLEDLDGKDEPRMMTAKCPRCGNECKIRGHWLADEGGYGSGGHPHVLTERRHAELMKALSSITEAVYLGSERQNPVLEMKREMAARGDERIGTAVQNSPPVIK